MAENPAAGQKRPVAANRKARALEWLLEGDRPERVAERLGCSKRTIRRYLADPRFAGELRTAHDERLRALGERAAWLAEGSLVRLRAIAEDGDAPATARVAACRAILEVGLLKLGSELYLAERLAAVEGRLAEVEGTAR